MDCTNIAQYWLVPCTGSNVINISKHLLSHNYELTQELYIYDRRCQLSIVFNCIQRGPLYSTVFNAVHCIQLYSTRPLYSTVFNVVHCIQLYST